MKKLLSGIIALLIVAGFAGCSAKQDASTSNTASSNDTVAETKQEITNIVSDDGEVFSPDLTTSGTLAQMSLSDKTVIICSKTYTMPIKMSDLMADGWSLTGGEFKNEFKPGVETNLASFAMKNADGAVINLATAYNDTDEVQKLEDCLISGLYFDHLHSPNSKISFVMPGGITENSTAGDVVGIYGDPNNSTIFVDHSYNLDHQLTYGKHKDSGLNFSYLFEEDGTIEYAKITSTIE